jgi:gamma-glutamyltranspeptidase / glutathione hydrolase
MLLDWAPRALAVAALVAGLAPGLRVLAAAPPPVEGRRGMVASSVGPAAAVGAELLARGGNAVDAAIGTGFAAGCAHPFSSGIGGGGFFVIRLADGSAFALDAREIAPAAASPTMFLRPDGTVDPEASRTGGLAVAVPALVQGFEAAHERFGKLPWAEVIAPAIRMCREGVEAGQFHRRLLGFAAAKLRRFPDTARIQLAAGADPPPGWRLVQADLARTYEEIAARGADAMTSGAISESIAAAVREAGGVITAADLASVQVVWRDVVRGTYRGREVLSMPPPSSGGVALIQMLHTLEPFSLAEMGAGSSRTLHHMAEAMKLAFADRAVHLGDPDFVAVPTERLISQAYGRALAERLRPPPFFLRPPWRWGEPHVLTVDPPVRAPRDDAGTTHISVLDAEGNAVALTQTINTVFGSGVTAPGTGIVLNNEMDDFAVAEDSPNAFELVGGDANAVAPGKRPLSSMTPTIVVRDGRAVLVSGSPAGPLIITTVLQTLVNVIDFEMDVQAAASAPRIHHQWRPDLLRLEPEHPRDVVRRLEEIGHPVEQGNRYLGASTTVAWDSARGVFTGAADPRRDAGAAAP